ncbi:hypothetical protein, partial [Salmonella sp. s29873]|uniref:hypothetical protein n=1 Tax=Salmonella sp. s29873 TaxID=3159634 RepID=UPI0039813DB2
VELRLLLDAVVLVNFGPVMRGSFSFHHHSTVSIDYSTVLAGERFGHVCVKDGGALVLVGLGVADQTENIVGEG